MSDAVLLREVLWRRLDQPAFEHCCLLEIPTGFELHGRVLTVTDDRPFQVASG